MEKKEIKEKQIYLNKNGAEFIITKIHNSKIILTNKYGTIWNTDINTFLKSIVRNVWTLKLQPECIHEYAKGFSSKPKNCTICGQEKPPF